jgi:hypothetical protein
MLAGSPLVQHPVTVLHCATDSSLMTANRTCDNHRSRLLPNELRDPGGFLKARWLWCLSVVILIMMTTCRAPAQAIPVLRLPVRFSVFGTFTDAKPHFGYYDDRAVWGGTTGGIMQLPRLGGVEVRGSLLRSGGLSHQESALIGPRVALHIFHVTPYGSLLFGEGNAWWWSNPPEKNLPHPYLEEGRGFQWSIVSGLDIHLHERISFRIGELSYSRLYTPGRNMTPLTASSGIVIRLH